MPEMQNDRLEKTDGVETFREDRVILNFEDEEIKPEPCDLKIEEPGDK